MLQQSFWLAKKEFKYHRLSLLFTVLFTIFYALLISGFLNQSVKKMFGPDMEPYNFFLLDFLFVIITLSLSANFMSGPYLSLRAIKEDPFSKRMAMLRTLPIPVPVLSLSRTLMMLMTLLVMSTVFFGTLAIALPDPFFQHIGPGDFVFFILFWLGCSLTIGGLNPFIEYGTNGKILHLTPYIFLVILLATITVFYQLSDLGLVELILLGVKSNGWILALFSLLLGTVACYFWNKILTIRLLKRDYD